MTPHTPLIEALKDALFALDGVLDGDFSPRGSTVKGAIKTVREALRIATETTEPDADKDGATKDDWSVEQLFEQIEMRLSCRHESELDGGDFRFIEDRLARIKGAQFAAQSSPSVQSIRAGEISFTLPPHAVRFLTEMCKRERHRMARESDLSLQSEAAFDSLNTIEESLP